MIPEKSFAQVTLDEIWRSGPDLELTSRRIERGFASLRPFGGSLGILATTDSSRPPGPELEPHLFSVEFLESHRDAVLDRIRRGQAIPQLEMRILLSHQVEPDHETLTTVIRLELSAAGHRSGALLTTPGHLEHDLDLLTRLSSPEGSHVFEPASLPLLWSNGTGGILLHEAVGHPAGRAPHPPWPEWLQVRDDPEVTIFETRLRGGCGQPRDLLASAPAMSRRASFRDPPMPRLTTLVASATAAPFEVPERHVEVLLAEGGSWDPITDRVRVRVLCADLVDGGERERLAPFTFESLRASIAASLSGARGEPVRYPGVLCSEHGQRIPVGTMSSDLLLECL